MSAYNILENKSPLFIDHGLLSFPLAKLIFHKKCRIYADMNQMQSCLILGRSKRLSPAAYLQLKYLPILKSLTFVKHLLPIRAHM